MASTATASSSSSSSSSSSAAPASSAPRVLFVGLGGGSCSGKTTLAKHILRILRAAGDERSFIVHQDDFAPREEDLPWGWNGDEKVRDWDTPHGSIDFGKMHSVMQYIRAHGRTPSEFYSHDKLNVLPNVPIPDELISRWAERLRQAEAASRRSDSSSAAREEGPIIVLVDGFLTYYDPRVRHELDVRFFTRCRREVMKSRRAQRSYTTAEETVWQDPPGYYDNIVWPAYVLAHKGMFENEDVENGALRPAPLPEEYPNDSFNGSASTEGTTKDPAYASAVAKEGLPGGPVRGLVILDERHEDAVATQSGSPPTQAVPMAKMVERACAEIERVLSAAPPS
ncbi:ribosylnicotinamide kinase [Tilletia horrida]|nr:ribosylnicotinamide kinase [Tilletia horrida]